MASQNMNKGTHIVNNNQTQTTSEEWGELEESAMKTLNEENQKLKDKDKNLTKIISKDDREKQTAQIFDLVKQLEVSSNNDVLDGTKKKLNAVSKERDDFNSKYQKLYDKYKVLLDQSLDMKTKFEECSTENDDLRKFKDDMEKEKTDYSTKLAGIKDMMNLYHAGEREAICKYEAVSETMKKTEKQLKEAQKNCTEQKSVISEYNKR